MSTKSRFEINAAAFIGSGERTTTKFPVAEYIRFSKGLADVSGHQLAIYEKNGDIFVIRRTAKGWSTKHYLHLEDADQFNVTYGEQPDTLIITHPDREGYYNIDLAKGKINMVYGKPGTGRRIHEVLVAAAEARGKAYVRALLGVEEAIHPSTQDENEAGEATTAQALAAADAQELAQGNMTDAEIAEIKDKANRFVESCLVESNEMALNALVNEALFIFEALSRIDKDAVQDLIHKVLKAHGAIALIWDTSDVLEYYSDLTEEEAQAVLEYCEAKHDCNLGMTWFSILNAVEALHPDYDKRAQEGAIVENKVLA